MPTKVRNRIFLELTLYFGQAANVRYPDQHNVWNSFDAMIFEREMKYGMI